MLRQSVLEVLQLHIYDLSLFNIIFYIRMLKTISENSQNRKLNPSTSELSPSSSKENLPCAAAKKRTPREIDFRLKFKTELCRNWENGNCEYGENCAFAHGYDELRNKAHLTSNYKTKKCKQFFEQGFCMYGNRCQFRHKEELTLKFIGKLGKRLPIFRQLEHRAF